MAEGNAQRIAKNTGFLYLRMMIVMLVSLFTSRIILRSLGFENFGIYNIVGSVVTFLSFLQAALHNATFRYLAVEIGKGKDGDLNKVYSMAINAHIILAFSLFVVMELGGIWFVNNKLVIPPERLAAANWAYQFSLINFCLSIILTPLGSSIVAHEKMDFYAFMSIIEVAFRLAIAYLISVIAYDKLIVYSILLTSVAVISFLIQYIYCKIKFKDCQYKRVWDKSVFKQFTSYSSWALLVNVATITRTQCINIFFNLFLGVLANAAMGVANQVMAAMNQFVTNFTQAFRPQIIKSWAAQDLNYLMRLIYSSSKMSYFLLLIISIPVVANINFFLTIWLVEYPPMAPVFIETIIIYYLIDALQEPLLTSVHATGKLKYHQIMVASIIILVIPTSYFLLKLGLPGYMVLAANAFANFLCAIGRTIYLKHLIGLDLESYMKKVIIPVSIVTVLAVILPLVMTQFIETNSLGVIVTTGSSMLWTATLCYFIGFDTNEKKYFANLPIVNKIFRKHA